MASVPQCEANRRRHFPLDRRPRKGIAIPGMSHELKNDSGPARNLLQSGIIFAAISLLTTLVPYVFQIIVSRQLGGETGEYGLVLTTLTFVGFLGLPLAIAAQAVTHYIARFHFSGDDVRLHGLLAGCRRFLFHVTIAGSVIAIILVKPLGDFFHIPRPSLTLIALACVLGGLWSSYVTALCQGLAWFKRLAFIGLLAAILRQFERELTVERTIANMRARAQRGLFTGGRPPLGYDLNPEKRGYLVVNETDAALVR